MLDLVNALGDAEIGEYILHMRKIQISKNQKVDCYGLNSVSWDVKLKS